MSRSLDGNGKLSLMISEAAGYAAGQNLRTLRHALLKLSYVLVIDKFRSVNTELTNLFSCALNGARTFIVV